jgi:hypothetical protein
MIEFEELKIKTEIENGTELLKCIILQINYDLIQSKPPRNLDSLRSVAAVFH